MLTQCAVVGKSGAMEPLPRRPVYRRIHGGPAARPMVCRRSMPRKDGLGKGASAGWRHGPRWSQPRVAPAPGNVALQSVDACSAAPPAGPWTPSDRARDAGRARKPRPCRSHRRGGAHEALCMAQTGRAHGLRRDGCQTARHRRARIAWPRAFRARNRLRRRAWSLGMLAACVHGDPPALGRPPHDARRGGVWRWRHAWVWASPLG